MFVYLLSSGDDRTRTCDPLHVKQMLSQLSYISNDTIISDKVIFCNRNLRCRRNIFTISSLNIFTYLCECLSISFDFLRKRVLRPESGDGT